MGVAPRVLQCITRCRRFTQYHVHDIHGFHEFEDELIFFRKLAKNRQGLAHFNVLPIK